MKIYSFIAGILMLCVLSAGLVGCASSDDQAPTKGEVDKGLEGQPAIEPGGNAPGGGAAGAGNPAGSNGVGKPGGK